MVWKKMDTFIPILSQINHYDEKHEDQTRSCRNSGLCSVHHRKFTCNFTFFQRQLARGYQGENLPVYPKSATNFIAWSEYYYQNGLRVTKNKITYIFKLLKFFKKRTCFWHLLTKLSKQGNILSNFYGLFRNPEVYLIAVPGQTSKWLVWYTLTEQDLFDMHLCAEAPPLNNLRFPDGNQIGQNWGTALKKCSSFWCNMRFHQTKSFQNVSLCRARAFQMMIKLAKNEEQHSKNVHA